MILLTPAIRRIILQARVCVFRTVTLVALVFFQSNPAFALPLKDTSKRQSASACPDAQHQKASAVLKDAFDGDQDDRKKLKSVGLANVSKRDVKRRELVSVVFAQGCMISAKDYYFASRVFQHGNVPDHYFQAYLWASAAVNLGYLEAQNIFPNLLIAI
ncbi:MAG: hypothetical protein COA84_15780 [Robiginitomaculum sp.]|nr:MAG: hypothetical protein COA84_15780 [Robiginitomaculum sp.]